MGRYVETQAPPQVRARGWAYNPHYVAFVTDDVQNYELRKMMVPVVKEVNEWKCNLVLVEAEKSLKRPSFGHAVT